MKVFDNGLFFHASVSAVSLNTPVNPYGSCLWLFIIAGGLMLFIGIAIRHWIKRKKFYRRNAAGLETFSSYGKSMLVHFTERLSGFIAIIFILAGGFFFLGGIILELYYR